MDKIKIFRDNYLFIWLGIFSLAAFGYFFFVLNYVLYFQETQSLFVFSGDYLTHYTAKPGGLLEYAGRFFTQFYAYRLTGSIIISVILSLPGLLMYSISRRVAPGYSFSFILVLVPSCMLLLMQANNYHLMEYNLGFILILVYFNLTLLSEHKYYKILMIVIWPLFYYLAGAYAFILAIMYILYNVIVFRERQAYVYSGILLFLIIISVLFFSKIVFIQTAVNILLFPLPLLDNKIYKMTFFILAGFIVVYPTLRAIVVNDKYQHLSKQVYSIIAAVILFLIGVFILNKTYSQQTARVVELEKLIFNEKWDEAIMSQEKNPARNLIGEYFYNIALSETDQLCDRLFFGSQDFGSGSIVLPWGDEHLNRGAYFYYSIGLINEAQRWAYEEMVVYGYRPQNIEILAKTCLINGDLRMAEKYLNILKSTFCYRDFAEKYLKMTVNPDLINIDPELSAKRKILPKSSFFIQFNEPQSNLPLILSAQPDNRKAFEYYIADLLLTKNIEVVMANVSKMEQAGYTRIPRFIEEAILIYFNSTKKYPNLGGLKVSADTQERFSKYFAAFVEARKNSSTLKETMQKKFGNTFWYYYHFK